MLSKGDELYDQRFGERYRVIEAARDSGGELVRIEDTAAPGPSRRPMSAHPAQRERFEVLSGTLGLTVDGEQHLLGPGDSFVVEPGARHLPRNAGEGELRFVAEMRPAGRFEEFLADITAVNNTEREGLAYLLTAARVINRFPDVEHPTPLPRALDRALFAILAAAGKLFGLRADPRPLPTPRRKPPTTWRGPIMKARKTVGRHGAMAITKVGYGLSRLLGAGIIVIGARFLVVPQAAAAAYGITSEQGGTASDPYLAVKGVRDIVSGVAVFALLTTGKPHPLGRYLAAASIIPIGDAVIVLRSNGAKATAYGVHGTTAAVMLATAALLLSGPE